MTFKFTALRILDLGYAEDVQCFTETFGKWRLIEVKCSVY